MAESREQKNARERQRYATVEGREKHRIRVRRWAVNNPGAVREHQRRARYDCTPTRPEAEWCECCGRLPEMSMCLDHDHSTGAFRGWIRSPCNRAIGQLGDNIEGVEKALQYLKRAQ